MNDWPFADAPDTLVFTTQPVLDGAPVRDVHHDQDGDWQVLCGTTLAVEDARLVHFGHLVELTPSLASLADLPRGWSAARCTDAGPDEWHRHPRTLRAAISGWLRRT
jgi:hypothetical protein